MVMFGFRWLEVVSSGFAGLPALGLRAPKYLTRGSGTNYGGHIPTTVAGPWLLVSPTYYQLFIHQSVS
jgi:hypothetical protein